MYIRIIPLVIGLLAATGTTYLKAANIELLNVSYDPTRELYAEFNKSFSAHWKKLTGDDVSIATSHGGSGSQSRAIQDGSEADVATLALAYDIDAIHDHGSTGAFDKPLIPREWQSRLPHNSSPYTSTISVIPGCCEVLPG